MILAWLVSALYFLALAAVVGWAVRRLDGGPPRWVVLASLLLAGLVQIGPLPAGVVPAPSELAAMPPYRDNVEAGRRAMASEPAARVVPAMVEVRRAVGRGELPLWNPRAAAGVPLLAAPEAQVGQPFVLAAWPLPPGPALAVTAALQLFVALVFGWLALRDLPLRVPPVLGGGGAAAAAAGSVAYAFAGVVPVLVRPEAHVAALFPALVYALGAVERRGRRADHLLTVAVGAAILLSGAPRAAAVAFAAALAFQLACLALRPPGERLPSFARTVALLALAAGLAAPVLVPTLRWLPSTEAAAGRAEERREVLREDPLGLRTLRGTWERPHRGDEPAGLWEPLARGSVLFLAALALVHGPVRRRAGPLWGVAVGAGLVALAAVAEPAPLSGALRYVHLAPRDPAGGPALFLLHFAVACLVASGVAAFLELRRRRPGLPALALAAVLAAGALWALGRAAGIDEVGWIPLVALLLIGLAPGALRRMPRATVVWPLVYIVAAEALLGAEVPRLSSASFYPPHPVVAALGHVAGADRGLRSIAVGPRLPPAVSMMLGLPDPRGIPGQRPAPYAELVRPLEARPGEWRPDDHPLYDLLAVHALLPAGPGVPEARPSALPLLFLPREARAVGPGGWIPQVLAVDDFARTALVPPGPGRRRAWRAAEPDAGRVAVGTPGSTRLTARCELPEERLLASSIYQDGGWRVLVDGRPVPTTVANGPFVAAWLPAGVHRVDLVYRPPGLVAGLACAGVAVVVCAAWLVPWRRLRWSAP